MIKIMSMIMIWLGTLTRKIVLAEARAENQSVALSRDDELFLNQVVASGLPDVVLAVLDSI